MPFLMINQYVWASLAASQRELVRDADEVRLGEMPLWIDVRDNSRWLIANDSRTTFEKNIELLEALAENPTNDPAAMALAGPPDWAREATDAERAEFDAPTPQALDSGVLLLEPVTVAETRSVEAILTELWQAIESNRIDPGHVRQIEAMAMTLREASVDFEPGKTERWQVVGAVSAALRPVFKVAQGIAALDTVLDIVTGTGWTQLASELVELVS